MKQFTDYEKENCKKTLEKKLDYHKSLLAAWQKVTRNYKKDGKPFADLAKNFCGVSVYNAKYTLQSGVKELTVTTQSEKNGYISEYIETSELVKYTKLHPAADRIIKESFLEEYFILTPDELTEKIEAKKEYHAGRIAELEKAIKENDRDNKTAEKLLETIAAALAKVNPDTASYYRENLIRNYY